MDNLKSFLAVQNNTVIALQLLPKIRGIGKLLPMLFILVSLSACSITEPKTNHRLQKSPCACLVAIYDLRIS